MEKVIEITLLITYGMIIIAAAAALIMPLVKAAGNPKALGKLGIGIGLIVLVLFVGYALSQPEETPTMKGLMAEYDFTLKNVKFVGGTLFTMYLLAILAVVGIVVSEVLAIFK